MIRGLACSILIGLTGVLAGCSSSGDATFATRNAQVEFDLYSFVRGQSNDLLDITQDLQIAVKKSNPSPRKLDRDLENSVTLMDQIHMNLPSLLAAQDVEIAELRQKVADGTIDKTILKARTSDMQTYRKALLASLDASASHAAFTVDALIGSTNPDLMQLSNPAKALSRDLRAARTMIQMQL